MSTEVQRPYLVAVHQAMRAFLPSVSTLAQPVQKKQGRPVSASIDRRCEPKRSVGEGDICHDTGPVLTHPSRPLSSCVGASSRASAGLRSKRTGETFALAIAAAPESGPRRLRQAANSRQRRTPRSRPVFEFPLTALSHHGRVSRFAVPSITPSPREGIERGHRVLKPDQALAPLIGLGLVAHAAERERPGNSLERLDADRDATCVLVEEDLAFRTFDAASAGLDAVRRRASGGSADGLGLPGTRNGGRFGLNRRPLGWMPDAFCFLSFPPEAAYCFESNPRNLETP